MAPPRAVSADEASELRRIAPAGCAASAFTIVTLLQISRKVMKAVSVDAEDLLDGCGQSWLAVAQRAVAGEQPAEGHGVGGEEDPHAELAPALRGERRLGGFRRVKVFFHGGRQTHASVPSIGLFSIACASGISAPERSHPCDAAPA